MSLSPPIAEPLRLALLAAMPSPLPQGSQVFLGAQARALAAAGAEVTLLCYGRGAATPAVGPEGAEPGEGDAARGAAMPRPPPTLLRAPRLLSPVPLRSGPSLGKPLADAALLATWLRARARRRYDVVLAHHAEAAVVACASRWLARVPVVYVAHTLLEAELAAFAPAPLARVCDRLGAAFDRGLVRAADAVIALSRAAAERLAPAARGPLEWIPPGLDPAPPPRALAVRAACARHGLVPGQFALYSGNLDAYQELPLLAAAAAAAPELAVVVATHESRRSPPAPLRVARAADAAEARALLFGAGAAVLPRRRTGGLPIKLLNAMEAARAIVAHGDVAEGLTHGESAWLLSPGAGAAEWAAALRAVLGDPALSTRLGVGARRVLETRHAWPALAARTLALCASVVRATGRAGA